MPLSHSIKSFIAGKDVPTDPLIACVTLVYVMSQAVDLYLFHFIFDIHLPVVAMLVMLTALSIANWRAVFEYLNDLKLLAAIMALWSVYLLVNGFLGEDFRTSIVLLFRFVGSWLIAVQLGIALYVGGEKRWKWVAAALLIGFFLVTLIWYLQSIRSPYLEWLQPGLRDPAKIQGWGGLYVNPNILGFALVSHAMAAIWYSLWSPLSIVIIPVVWLTALAGILQSRSSNSFIGIILVGFLALFAYTQCHWSALPTRRRWLRPAAVFAALIGICGAGAALFFQPQLQKVLEPFQSYLGANTGWSTLPDEPEGAEIARVYDDERQSHVYELAGSGLPHHYVYSFGGVVTQEGDDCTLGWRMQFSQPFVLTVSVQTDRGPDELLYTSPRLFIDTVYEAGLAFDLGPGVTDGQWHSVTRDLQADLQKGTPGVTLVGVKSLLVRGAGRIDDIQFSSHFHDTFDHRRVWTSHDFERVLSRIDIGRVRIWKRSIGYWKERPWLGIGFGSFQYLPEERTFFHAHNFLLNLLVEQGLLGLGLLLAFSAVLLWQMKSWVGAALLGSSFGSQLFDNLTLDFSFPIYTSFVLGYCFFLVIGRKANEDSCAT